MLDWQSVVNSDRFTPVMKLVHLAARKDKPVQDALKTELVKIRRKAYEHELDLMLRQVGCPQSGQLTTGPALTELDQLSQNDAASIINTYNYDLAYALIRIKTENTYANRHYYADRLTIWERERNIWKLPQIALYSENTARSLAQRDFITLNQIEAIAVLEPDTAKCPVCQGWIRRGEVPAKEATANPGPFHVNCPHVWKMAMPKVAQGECSELWIGE
jgi:hypothetical protein